MRQIVVIAHVLGQSVVFRTEGRHFSWVCPVWSTRFAHWPVVKWANWHQLDLDLRENIIEPFPHSSRKVYQNRFFALQLVRALAIVVDVHVLVLVQTVLRQTLLAKASRAKWQLAVFNNDWIQLNWILTIKIHFVWWYSYADLSWPHSDWSILNST